MALKTILEAQTQGNNQPALYLVIRSDTDAVVGLLEKYRNTRTDTHPWKAFLGYGLHREFLGAFYDHMGGRRAALAAIASRLAGSARPADRVPAGAD